VPIVTFTPTFEHVDLVDQVDLVEADGSNGLNKRFNAIEGDLHKVSETVAVIDTTLDRLTPPAQQRLSVPLALTSVAPGTGWTVDANGAAHPAVGAAGTAVMNLTLPNQILLSSFRVVGQFGGPPATLAVRLLRAPLGAANPTPEKLAEFKGETAVAFDAIVTVTAAFASVNTAAYRYFVAATAGSIVSAETTSVAAIQLIYSVG
jgi:hypothetical protein